MYLKDVCSSVKCSRQLQASKQKFSIVIGKLHQKSSAESKAKYTNNTDSITSFCFLFRNQLTFVNDEASEETAYSMTGGSGSVLRG